MSMQIKIDPQDHYLKQNLVTRDSLEEACGMIPGWVYAWGESGHSWEEIINIFYAHGGGWQPFNEFSVDTKTGVMSYPGDSDLIPLVCFTVPEHAAKVYIYQHAWVTVIYENGEHTTARMD